MKKTFLNLSVPILGCISVVVSLACLWLNPLKGQDIYEGLNITFVTGHWATLAFHIPYYFLGYYLRKRNLKYGNAILIGTTGILVYNYLWLSITQPLSLFYPVYLILTGIAFYQMVFLLIPLLKENSPGREKGTIAPAVYLGLIALSFYFLWFQEIFHSLSSGNPLPHSEEWHTTTSPVYLVDLAFFLPALLLTAWLNWKGDKRSSELYLSALSMILTLAAGMITSRIYKFSRGIEFSKGSLIYLIVVAITGLFIFIYTEKKRRKNQ